MPKSKFSLTFQFLFTFCILACVPSLYFHNEFSQLKTSAQRSIEQSNFNKLEYSKVEFQHSLSKLTTSLNLLSRNGVLNQAVTKPTSVNIELLQDFWLLIAKTQGYYSQLRFISADGMEMVRINSNERVTEIVNNSRLQYKGDRDYFRYAQTLKQNERGTFGIDYEIEHGEPVRPLIPVFRVIYPITINGERLGYFIANLNLNHIYQNLAYKGMENNLPEVVDSNGYYVMTNSGEEILGHLFENMSHHNLSATNPKAWRQIQLNDSGTIEEDGYWVTFTKIQFNGAKTLKTLVFVMKTNAEETSALTQFQSRELYMKAILTLIITLLISFTFVTWSFNHEKNSLDSQIALAAMNGMSAVVITDKNNRIIQVNEEFTRVSGYSLEEVVGQKPSLFASGEHDPQFYIEMWAALEADGVWEGEVVNKRRDGSIITEILRIQTVKNRRGVINYYVASFVDISQRKELEDKLRALSEKDALTGLWNRRKFDIDMQTQLQRSKRYSNNEPATLAILDIDHFKRVNDHFGHDKGDEVIRDVAFALKRHLRETDIISRIGGEEFAVIMPHTTAKEADVVLNRVRTAINIESELGITISIGFSQVSGSTAQTYKRADTALYDSKTGGRNRVSQFSLTDSESIA